MKNITNKNLLADISRAVFVTRSRCGLTQAKLAKMVKTEQSGIARLENSTHFPSFRFVDKVANALDQNIIFRFEPKDPKDIRFMGLGQSTELNLTMTPTAGSLSGNITSADRNPGYYAPISGSYTSLGLLVV